MLSHYKQCQDSKCPLCGPVKAATEGETPDAAVLHATDTTLPSAPSDAGTLPEALPQQSQHLHSQPRRQTTHQRQQAPSARQQSIPKPQLVVSKQAQAAQQQFEPQSGFMPFAFPDLALPAGVHEQMALIERQKQKQCPHTQPISAAQQQPRQCIAQVVAAVLKLPTPLSGRPAALDKRQLAAKRKVSRYPGLVLDGGCLTAEGRNPSWQQQSLGGQNPLTAAQATTAAVVRPASEARHTSAVTAAATSRRLSEAVNQTSVLMMTPTERLAKAALLLSKAMRSGHEGTSAATTQQLQHGAAHTSHLQSAAHAEASGVDHPAAVAAAAEPIKQATKTVTVTAAAHGRSVYKDVHASTPQALSAGAEQQHPTDSNRTQSRVHRATAAPVKGVVASCARFHTPPFEHAPGFRTSQTIVKPPMRSGKPNMKTRPLPPSQQLQSTCTLPGPSTAATAPQGPRRRAKRKSIDLPTVQKQRSVKRVPDRDVQLSYYSVQSGSPLDLLAQAAEHVS